MRGIPFFNFPAFHSAAHNLRKEGWFVFSPAEADVKLSGGRDISANNPTGDERQCAKEHGLTIRQCLAADLKFICEEADALALLPGWEHSKGALAERATALALGLYIFEYQELGLQGDTRKNSNGTLTDSL